MCCVINNFLSHFISFFSTIKTCTNIILFLGKSSEDWSVITGLAVHMENLSALPALQHRLVGVHIVDMGVEPVSGRNVSVGE